MLDLPVLYLIAKAAAVTASYLISDYAKTDITVSIIFVLSFVCVFLLELLIERIWNKKTLLYITIASSIIACFFISIDMLFPLFAVLLMHLVELAISGEMYYQVSIISLMKNDNKKAADSIEKAVKNLRDSVDEIRTALKEERTDRYLIDIQDINSILEQFKVKYNISTLLKTSGDLSKISPQIWLCIHDNLKECLTNVLKHSNATEFVLSIQVFNKIIKVEYKDNGRTGKGFEKHLGLDAIEERTASVKGRCFINKDEDGFCVTNIFNY